MKLSVCMIVRNEEKNLSRCLNECKLYADEIVVIDTGSTDNTISIAKKHADIVKEIEWKQDFAYARNFAIDQAHGEWILVLDADEVLPTEEGKRLKDFLSTDEVETVEAFIVTVCNFIIPNNVDSAENNKSLRIFQNKEYIRYEGKVHEQIKGIMHIGELPIVINHYGYIDSEMQRKDKHKRNHSLLTEALKENPNNKYYLYHLGVNAYSSGNDIEAERVFVNLLPLFNGDETYAPRAYKCLALCYKRQMKFDEMRKIITIAIDKWPNFTDLYYIQALAYKEQGAYSEALAILKKCLKLGEAETFDTHHGVGSIRPLKLMMHIYLELGHRETALQYLKKLLRYEPNNVELFILFCNLLYQDQKIKESKQYLHQFAKEHTNLIDKMFEHISLLKNYHLVYFLGDKLHAEIKLNIKSSFIFACGCLYLEQWSRALAVFNAIKYNFPNKDKIIRFIYYCLKLMGQREQCDKVLNEFITTADRKVAGDVFEVFARLLQGKEANLKRINEDHGVDKTKQELLCILREIEPLNNHSFLNAIKKLLKEVNVTCQDLIKIFDKRAIPDSFVEFYLNNEELDLASRYQRLKSLSFCKSNEVVDFLISEAKDLLNQGARAVGIFDILSTCYLEKAQRIRGYTDE